ncbi:MAG TPA: helix-turn-helix domain-containing protein [Gemmatimonadaceae bacterium]|nr:helix-turn-helix domain-containing protein [Gemmatimonadaceae bacterium]
MTSRPTVSAARPQKAAGVRNDVADGHGSKSEAVRERAVLALLSERTIGAAAKQAGVSERTLRRWMLDDVEFRDALAEGRRVAYDAGIYRIQALTARAVETLDELLDAEKHPAVRLGAARSILELATTRHDADTLLARLEDLEEHHA